MRLEHRLGGCKLFKTRHNFGQAVGLLNRLARLSRLLSLSPCDGSSLGMRRRLISANH